MKLLSERDQIKEIINVWIKVYGLNNSYPSDTRNRQVGKELLALDPDRVSSKELKDIIGNHLSVEPVECDECGKKTWDLVELVPATLCKDCLTKALSLLTK